jgi:hypothetical protein
MGEVRADQQRDVRIGFIERLQTHGLALIVAGPVGEIPVSADRLKGGAQRELVADRQVDVACQSDKVIVAHLQRQVAAIGGEARLIGNDVDRAGGGVSTVERALRAFKHLYAL